MLYYGLILLLPNYVVFMLYYGLKGGSFLLLFFSGFSQSKPTVQQEVDNLSSSNSSLQRLGSRDFSSTSTLCFGDIAEVEELSVWTSLSGLTSGGDGNVLSVNQSTCNYITVFTCIVL